LIIQWKNLHCKKVVPYQGTLKKILDSGDEKWVGEFDLTCPSCGYKHEGNVREVLFFP